MAKGFNITSASFSSAGAQAMGSPVQARMQGGAESSDDSTGVDKFIATQKPVRAKVNAQVSFNDLEDALALLENKWLLEGILTVVVPLATTGTKTITLIDALLLDVALHAQHAEVGAHVATFEARAIDGVTNPFSSA